MTIHLTTGDLFLANDTIIGGGAIDSIINAWARGTHSIGGQNDQLTAGGVAA